MLRNGTVYEAIRAAGNKYPNRNAIYFMKKYITYDQLLDKIDMVASGLVKLGIGRDDVVTIAMPNTIEAVYLFYAVNRVGAIGHMVHPLTPAKQLERYMEAVKSKTLFIVDVFLQAFQDLLKDPLLRVVVACPVGEFGVIKQFLYRLINHKKLKLPKTGADRVIPFKNIYNKISTDYIEEKNPERTAVYLHSGGTSGEAKIVELSNLALNNLADRYPEILQLETYEEKYVLSVLPMFHGFGLCECIHSMLCHGGVDALMPKFDPRKTVQLIKENKVNVIIAVPSLFSALVNCPEFAGDHLKNLKRCYVGGDYVSTSLKKRFNNLMKQYGSDARLLEGYGLTEVVAVCTVNKPDADNPETVGSPISDIEIRILDTETRAILPANTSGEIAIAGDTMMTGYFNDPQATKKAFMTDESGKVWLLTGDYGFLDEKGYLHFKQRIKRLVKVHGMTVLPSEIENLLANLEEISEVAAIGVPNEKKGHLIKLFVVLNPKVQRLHDDDSIRKLIRMEISRYAVPKEIVYIDALPRTGLGKVDTRKLETM
ncbi:MAG: acyl--CoA ligase [Acholeplasmataceae bacterium]|nr:acyl--CoA ligase [Acholeplasmataceae bacterium]